MTKRTVRQSLFIVPVDVPVFTSELEAMNKDKDEDMDDGEEMEEGSSESVSSFEDGGMPKSRKKINEEYPDVLEDSEEEKEDYTIRKNDSLLVAATVENEHSNLEVYIYDH